MKWNDFGLRGRWIVGLLLVSALVLSSCQVVLLPSESAAEHGAEGDHDDGDEMMAGDPVAGEYIFAMTTGCGCHFNRDLGGLAGGNKFEGGFGVVHSANITPDEVTGIGSWSDEEIANAFRFAQHPAHDGHEGGNLFIMPAYAHMADKDAMDLIAYLRSLDPLENEVPERELNFEPAAFEVSNPPPAEAPTDPVARGVYLASFVRCARCHTPRNEDGSMNMDLFLAGAPFRDTIAPNLTPDEATGLGAWTEQEIADFMQTGIYSDGTESHAGMKSQIDRGLNKLTDDDALAIAAWLKSLDPIENLPEPPSQ
ncbi:cytochrome c [Chloroflexi bacterium TSY]|nr:cytochrome c [Chloroflexi bacterium TSY]